MSSILDHVEQSVPRSTVYGAMKGSPVFIGKYFREINPSSNADEYNYVGGERIISFIIASPDKTIFNDMRSSYLKLRIEKITDSADEDDDTVRVSEPVSNIIKRIVVRMNGTVIEDISRFDYLTSFFKKSLLKRDEKNARQREGWDYISRAGAVDTAGTRSAIGIGCKGVDVIEPNGKKGSEVCIKLDLSGVMNIQQLLSGYYCPIEIDVHLQDPLISCELNKEIDRTIANVDINLRPSDIVIKNPMLCIDQIVMSPEYVGAFERALIANSSTQGIQIPFSTYFTYSTDVEGDDVTFWIRKPIRFLRSIYWGATHTKPMRTSNYVFYRQTPNIAMNAALTNPLHDDEKTTDKETVSIDGENVEVNRSISDPNQAGSISAWQVAIGSKSYREIREEASALQFYNESQIMFAKAVGHYNDYSTESDEYKASQRKLNMAVQGIDLEYSPDNDVLASETTLNSNDIRLTIKQDTSSARHRIMVFINYQASIALFPGNETRLLVT